MTASAKEVQAKLEADRARARLMESAHALQARLSPSVLARDTWTGAKMKGADLVEDAVDAVKARPLTATGVAAAIALFLAREPLIDLAGKLAGGKGDKKEAKPARKRSRKSQTRHEPAEKG